MNKRSNGKAQPSHASHASHPETKVRRAATGTPGTESSKVQSTGKDLRNAHDKDGNSAQRAR